MTLRSDQFVVPRMSGSKINADVREQVVAAFIEGSKMNEIAKKFGISTAGVRGIIKSNERIDKVRNNKIDYGIKERMQLMNKAFFKVEEMIERCSDEFRMKSLVDALNVLIHTRRIEEGLNGATPSDTKPFTMNVIVNSQVTDLANQDEMPELASGDIVDVNPMEEDIKQNTQAQPEPSDDWT